MLEEWRNEIDIVDLEIIELLNKRLTIVSNIGNYKRLTDQPIYNPLREKEQLEKWAQVLAEDKNSPYIIHILKTVVEVSRSKQENTLKGEKQNE